MASERPRSFFTDAEVLQELLHRYLALRVWPRGGEVIRNFSTIMRGRVEPIRDTDVEAAVTLADHHLSSGLSARDLLHAVVIARIGATEVISADKGFDKLPELELLDPKDFDTWHARLDA
jgi:predicted nucleic acid-binding protein